MKPGGEPRIVEFFGLPGAGKTTAVNALIARGGGAERLPLAAEWREIAATAKLRVVAQSLADFRLVSASFAFAVSNTMYRPRDLLRLVRINVLKSWYRSQHGRLVIDQGFVQHLVSLQFSKTKAGRAKRVGPFLQAIYRDLNATLVYLEVDHKAAADRVDLRNSGGGRLDGQPAELVEEALANWQSIPDQFADAATGVGLELLRIDANASVSKVQSALETIA